MLVEAPGEKLVPGVDGCLLRLVHQDVFFLQAQAAGVVAIYYIYTILYFTIYILYIVSFPVKVEYVLGYLITHEAMFPSKRGVPMVIFVQIVIFFVFFFSFR